MARTLSIAFLAAAVLWPALAVSAEPVQPAEPPAYVVHPIGRVQIADGRTLIVLDKKYESGLLGLDGYSHLLLFWWLDKNDTAAKRAVLQVHPRGNPQNPLTGVFACRSPFRPNLIALTVCKIIAVKDNTVQIESTDAFDGTPVLDIKPFLPGYDTAAGATVPKWASAGSPGPSK
ncbi:MAG: tRNA (N6-threonylcarbamoyladenosine(37)-N6)-methyltransferase TrmO [Thermoguttaceae bacterium]